jgi:hypothetical protein
MNARTFEERAAGFFAAEGCFGFYKNRAGVIARLVVSQKERYWLDLLKALYKGGVFPSNRVWHWNAHGTAAEALYAHFVEQAVTWPWIVGFWEGDGSVIRSNGSFGQPTVTFDQKDSTVSAHVRECLGVGNVLGPYPCGIKKVLVYRLNIGGEDARGLTLKLYEDVISPRRKAQLEPYVEAIHRKEEADAVRTR